MSDFDLFDDDFDVDFTGVPENSNVEVLLPSGQYTCRLDDIVKQDRQPGKTFSRFAWRFTVLDEGEYKDVPLYHSSYDSEKAKGRFRDDLMRALGHTIPATKTRLSDLIGELSGATVILTVEPREWDDGTIHNNVKRMRRAPVQQASPVEETGRKRSKGIF